MITVILMLAKCCSATSANAGWSPGLWTHQPSSGTKPWLPLARRSPVFGRRQVRAIKPSQIQAWIGQLSERFESSTVIAAFLVLQGIFELAVADDAMKVEPGEVEQSCSLPPTKPSEIQVWADGGDLLSDRRTPRFPARPARARSLLRNAGEGNCSVSLWRDFDFH